MSTGINFFLALLACISMSTSAIAASNRPANVWNYYHFEGVGFKAGPSTDGSAFIAVRERVQPVVLLNQSSNIEAIDVPKDSGVIAGICYFKSSGGRLGNNSGYIPCPRTPLLISAEGKQLVTVQTDEQGYFVAVLPAGEYTIGNGPFTDKISVDNWITTLVPLMAGKRMVD